MIEAARTGRTATGLAFEVAGTGAPLVLIHAGVVGEADQRATLDAANRLAAEIPDVRMASWPDTAHMLTLERPAQFEALVLGFLATVG